MAVERAAGRASLIDVLDRVLDKGIVVDPWARVANGPSDLSRVHPRVEVGEVIGGRGEHEARPAEPGVRDDRPSSTGARTART